MRAPLKTAVASWVTSLNVIIIIIIIVIIILLLLYYLTIKTCDKTSLNNIVRFKKLKNDKNSMMK